MDGLLPLRSGSAKAGRESGLKVRLYAILTLVINFYNRRYVGLFMMEDEERKMCEVVAPSWTLSRLKGAELCYEEAWY